MAGITFTIPNTIATEAGPTVAASKFDANWTAIQTALSGLVAALTDLPSAVNATGTRAWAQGAAIASAATLNLGADGNAFHVTGATGPITAISTKQAGTFILLLWDSTPTLTHNATALALLGAANRTVAAGDMSLMYSKGGGNWREILYIPLTNSDSSHFLAGDWTWRAATGSVGGKASTTLSGGSVTTVSAAMVDITGLTCTVTMASASSTLLVGMTFSSLNTGANSNFFDISVDGTSQFSDGTDGIPQGDGTSSAIITLTKTVTGLATGARVVKGTWRVSAGTGTVTASAQRKATIWAVEIL